MATVPDEAVPPAGAGLAGSVLTGSGEALGVTAGGGGTGLLSFIASDVTGSETTTVKVLSPEMPPRDVAFTLTWKVPVILGVPVMRR